MIRYRLLLGCALLFSCLSLISLGFPTYVLHDPWIISSEWSIGGNWVIPEETLPYLEPRLTGGLPQRPETPLEKLKVPTPLPYEVAPPEAQWGTIGLILISGAMILYFRRKPATIKQRFKQRTSPRVPYGPRKRPKRKTSQGK